VLQICHEWAQECHTEFDYGDKLGFLHVHKSKRELLKKKKKQSSRRGTLPTAGLGKRLLEFRTYHKFQMKIYQCK
jgi:hypothetical protein